MEIKTKCLNAQILECMASEYEKRYLEYEDAYEKAIGDYMKAKLEGGDEDEMDYFDTQKNYLQKKRDEYKNLYECIRRVAADIDKVEQPAHSDD